MIVRFPESVILHSYSLNMAQVWLYRYEDGPPVAWSNNGSDLIRHEWEALRLEVGQLASRLPRGYTTWVV